MSTTLLRLGLWIVVLVLALYVLAAAYPDEPLADYITPAMLSEALVVAGILVVVGVLMRILGQGAKKVVKHRCRECRTPVPTGAIYCRAHLRSILAEEDEKTHMTKVRR